MSLGTKRCARCRETKAASEFYGSKRFPGGLRTWCKACERAGALVWRTANREKALQNLARWRAANVEKERLWRRKHYREHREDQIAKSLEWARKNRARATANLRAQRARNPLPHRLQERERQRRFPEINRARAREWARKNPGRVRANVRVREIAERRATPKWANRFIMGEIYDLARLRTKYLGIAHEVDHIVPIKGRTVCGLHCEQNMRVVPAAVNRAKRNFTWPDMP